MSSPEEAEPPTKKLRRSYVACHRCHSHKIKCSGETPCRSCRKSNNSTQCVYPVRDRKVVISESYLKKLEEENSSLKRASPSSSSCIDPRLEDGPLDTKPVVSEVNVCGVDVSNPLLEEPSRTRFEKKTPRPLYLGGAACTAFGTRLRKHVKGNDPMPQARRMVCYKHRGLLRIANTEFQLPNKTYAKMLVQVVLRFIGPDFHLLQRKSFMKKLEEAYTAQTHEDPVFLCRLFVIFALGELYSKKTSMTGTRRIVPGTGFFLQAMSLFQDLHEEADVDYIETLLVISFYSHALNRKNSAYTYAGLALRLSLTLGLHRNITYDKSVSPVEIENRRRVWWTVYAFDRICSAKLGHPVMLRDENIDAPLPSLENLSQEQQEEFVDAAHLVANVKLARITGSILDLIYCIPSAQQEANFVDDIQKILNDLKEWDATLPSNLKLDHTKSPPYMTRPVASLRLHFNHCIMLTTRPILLYVFKNNIQPAGTPASPRTPRPLSQTTTALSDACIQAARSSNKLLAQLWIDGAIATFGYFDAHHIFSSTMVLLMASILYPTEADKDALDLAWSLLQTMADDGNLPASEYCERLALLQKDLEDTCGDGAEMAISHAQLCNTAAAAAATPRTGRNARNDSLASSDIDPKLEQLSPLSTAPLHAQSQSQQQPSAALGTGQITPQSMRGGEPLDGPYLQDFLTQQDDGWSPGALGLGAEGAVPWAWEGEFGGGFGQGIEAGS